MNRRCFLQVGLITGISSPFLAAESGQTEAHRGLEGADPTGVSDSKTPFLNVIAALPQRGGRLSIPRGIYRFKETNGALFKIEGAIDFQVDGNGSTFLFEGNTRPFEIKNCQEVVIKNLIIDWSRPPFSQGTVVAAGAQWIEVKVDPVFPVTGKEQIEAIGEYDRATGIMSVDGLDLYGHVHSVKLIGPQELRINLTLPNKLQPGAMVVLRHRVYGVDVLDFASCKNVRVEDVNLHAAPGMGIVARSCTGVAIHRLQVVPTPGTNRIMSLCADATHLTDCQGKLEILDCTFQGMGDDAINICSTFWRITNVVDDKTWRVEGRNSHIPKSWQLPTPGTELQLCDPKSLRVLGIATVSQSASNSEGAMITISETAHVPEGTLVCDSQNKTTSLIANCNFKGNRARAVIAHSNTTITNNSFYGQSLAAILLAVDGWWMEGPVVQNVEISGNSFAHNYTGQCALRRGAITVDTAHDPTAPPTPEDPVNKLVCVYNNIFHESYGEAVYINRTSEVSIIRNSFDASSLLLSQDSPKIGVFVANAEPPLLAANVIVDREILICPAGEITSGLSQGKR
jgi:hypothetical protein